MLERENAVLIVIDLQDKLLDKIPVAEDIIERATMLIKVAQVLDIPVILTEQYPKGLGPTNRAVRETLGDVTPIEKLSFGCMGNEDFRDRLHELDRGQLLITGVETHVCVAQTAIGALDMGYDTYVARDAVAARSKFEHKMGLERIADECGGLVTTEMAIFELLGEAGTPEFKQVLPLLK